MHDGQRLGIAVMLTILFTIWLLHTAAMMSPGANVLLVSQLAASGDARGAWYAGLGIATGALIWVSSAVLGIHVIFVLFPALRLGLQIIGGMYLLYVASKIWRSASVALDTQRAAVPPRQAYRLGFLTNMTNPKSALFFGSIFATAFPPQPDISLQAATVGMVVLNALCWHLFLAKAFSLRALQVFYARRRGTLNRLSATALGSMGVVLLLKTLQEARR